MSSQQEQGMRLNQCLARLGACGSRREADTLIKQGGVAINRQQVADVGTQIVLYRDTISVNGKDLTWKFPPLVYWLLHKPKGYLVSRRGEESKPTIFDLRSLRKIRFPLSCAGRLDYQSEGLLLLTNDGDLIYRLCHPRFGIEKSYHVLLNRKLSPEQSRLVREGDLLADGKVRYLRLKFQHREFLGKSYGYWYTVTVKEGRNHLIRRIFMAIDTKVLRLIRVSCGKIQLPTDLPPGEYRQLPTEEISYLKGGNLSPLNP